MSLQLTPCAGCSRHVKHGECTCPFCGTKVSCAGLGPRAPGGRMSRAAMFAAGAVGVAVGTTDCGLGAPLYGGSFPPATSDASDATGTDAGSTPPVDDAGPADAGNTPADDGSMAAPDAETTPDGGSMTTPDATAAPDARPMPTPLYGGFFPPVDAASRKD